MNRFGGIPAEQVRDESEANASGGRFGGVPVQQQPKPTGFNAEAKADAIVANNLTGFEENLQATALGLNYIYNETGKAVSRLTPQGAKDFLGETMTTMGSFLRPIIKSPSGQLALSAASAGGEAWDYVESAYPRTAENIKAAGTIGFTVAMGARPAAKLTDKYVISRFKYDWLDDVVKPMRLKDADLSMLRTEGIRGKPKFLLNKDQKAMKNVLKTVPNVKRGDTHSRTYEFVRDHNIRSAQDLRWKLEASNKPVSKKELDLTIKKAVKNYNAELDLSKRLKANKAQEFVDDVKDRIKDVRTTGQLLEARKAADARFRKFSGERRASGLLAPTKNELKWRHTRDSLNALLEMKEPGYKKEITRQHLMYKTMDVLEDKVYAEVEYTKKSFIEKHLPKITAAVVPRGR